MEEFLKNRKEIFTLLELDPSEYVQNEECVGGLNIVVLAEHQQRWPPPGLEDFDVLFSKSSEYTRLMVDRLKRLAHPDPPNSKLLEFCQLLNDIISFVVTDYLPKAKDSADITSREALCKLILPYASKLGYALSSYMSEDSLPNHSLFVFLNGGILYFFLQQELVDLDPTTKDPFKSKWVDTVVLSSGKFAMYAAEVFTKMLQARLRTLSDIVVTLSLMDDDSEKVLSKRAAKVIADASLCIKATNVCNSKLSDLVNLNFDILNSAYRDEERKDNSPKSSKKANDSKTEFKTISNSVDLDTIATAIKNFHDTVQREFPENGKQLSLTDDKQISQSSPSEDSRAERAVPPGFYDQQKDCEIENTEVKPANEPSKGSSKPRVRRKKRSSGEQSIPNKMQPEQPLYTITTHFYDELLEESYTSVMGKINTHQLDLTGKVEIEIAQDEWQKVVDTAFENVDAALGYPLKVISAWMKLSHWPEPSYFYSELIVRVATPPNILGPYHWDKPFTDMIDSIQDKFSEQTARSPSFLKVSKVLRDPQVNKPASMHSRMKRSSKTGGYLMGLVTDGNSKHLGHPLFEIGCIPKEVVKDVPENEKLKDIFKV